MYQSLRYCQLLLLTTPLVFSICLTVSGQNLGDGSPLSRRGEGTDRITSIRSSPDRLWQLTGPFGGDVTVLVIDPRNPDRILIGTSDGQLYQSLNGGRFWQNMQPGPGRAGQTITAILFDRQDRRRIYVSLKSITALSEHDRGGGLFVSEDDGAGWRALPGLTDKPIRGVAQSGSDPRVLAVAALDGVYRTRDSGTHWEKISPAGRSEMRGFHSVAIDPRSAEIIYAGTSHLPWKTLDGGKNWQLAGSALTGMLDDSDIFSIQIEENTPNTILLSACSGIYRSFDASATWTKFKGIPTESRRTQIIYRHPTRPALIFAGTTEGLWRSDLYGMAESWRRVTSEHLLINSVAVHPSRPDRVFIGTEDGGVLISEDGGETWESSNEGFINRQVGAVLADLGERGRIYAGILFDGESSGLFISVDGGLTWKQSVSGLGSRDVYSLYQSPYQTGTIYAGTNQGIYRSDDQGESWREVRRAAPPATPVIEKKAPPARRPSRRPGQRAAVVRTAPRPTTPAKPTEPIRVDLGSQIFSINSFTPRPEDSPSAPSASRQWLIASTWDGLYLTEDESTGWRRITINGPSGRWDPHVRTIATSHQA
ncbi:MAG: WD40/YVTN/BNR-like repeat-containing protein, partial [Acidobacteriota bacterium]